MSDRTVVPLEEEQDQGASASPTALSSGFADRARSGLAADALQSAGAALLDLAERCEKASGPDRELDAEIGSEMVRTSGWHPAEMLRSFTSSIDAAMTLVPEGWAVEHWQIWPGQPSTLGLYETREAPGGERYRGGGEAIAHASAATPALALCAASLKARAASAMSAGTAETAQQAQGQRPASAVPEGQTPNLNQGHHP